MSQAIFSLKPRYARMILSGDKTVELRNRVVRLESGTVIWMYATRPVASIVGVARIETVVHAGPAEIWDRFAPYIGVDRDHFNAYTGNKECVSALVLRSVETLARSVTLDRIRRSARAFQPPQFYVRLTRGSRLRRTLDTLSSGHDAGGGWVEAKR